jgi:hypothetical protein
VFDLYGPINIHELSFKIELIDGPLFIFPTKTIKIVHNPIT